MKLSMRRKPVSWMLLGCLLALCACSDLGGPSRVDRRHTGTYACNPADPMDESPACGREPQGPPH